MPATTRRNPEPVTEPVTAPVSDDADQLRALVSAMLSGTYKEEFYLWDVASLCRAKPEFARQLLTLIDRYHRLGQMSAAQHQKIKDKIDQTVASRAAPLSRNRAPESTDTRARATTTAPLPAAEPAPASAPAAAAPAAPDTPAAQERAQPVAAAPAVAAPAQAAAQADATAQSPAEASAPPPAAAVAPATPAQAADTAPASAAGPTAAAVAATAATRPVGPAVRVAAAAPPAPAAAEMTAVELLAAAQRMDAAALAAARSWAQGAPPTQTAAPGRAQSAAQSTPAIAPGTLLCNRYDLQALLGSGGMGSVYRALDRYRASLGLPDSCVALKIVTSQPLGAANALALVREFHNAQQLSHPNVINVYEIDHEGDASFYTMELLDGERLSQLLERTGGPLSAPYALSIIRDIGAAIAHAHSRGVVHGDLKPHNIFITYGGQVRVLDFGGLSHSPPEPWIADPDSPGRSRSYRTATPAYASYEQLQGRRAEPRDDIYAVACIAYELLTGRHPFDCKSSTEARAQHLRPSRPPRVSTECWRALRHGLAWERAQRPAQIEPWLEQLGVAAAAEQLPPTHQLTAAPPRRSGIAGAITAAVLLLALGAAVVAVELHGNVVDWRAGLTAASGRLQSTWHQWRTTADEALPGGAPADSAPVAAGAGAGAEALVGGATTAAGEPQAAAPSDADQGHRAHARGHRIPRAAVATSGDSGRDETGAAAAPGDTLAAAPDDARSAAEGDGAAVDRADAAGAAPDASGIEGADTAATGPAADQGAAGAIGVQFAAPSYRVADTAPAARVVIRRTGSARDEVRFVWWTVEDSAKAEVDYAPLGVRTEDIPSGADDITIYIPIISNPLRHETTRFYVALGPPGTPARPAVPSARAAVTIERGG